MNDEIPRGWAEVRVGEVLKLVNGFPFKPSQWRTSGLPIIRIQNLNNANAPYNCCAETLPDKFRVAQGDLLFAWSGTPGTSFGAHIWGGGDAWLNQHIFRADFDARVFDRSFLKFGINENLTEYIRQAHGGAGLAHITKSVFETSTLRIAPLPEQRRIAIKLQELLRRIKACEERLEGSFTFLRRFRQSVLAAACSGRLTADWRQTTGATDSWQYHRLSELGSVTGGITKNAHRLKMKLQLPYLRVANVYENRLDLHDVFQIGVTEQEYERTCLAKGDLLFVEGNGSLDQIGRVALWDGSIARCVHQNHLIKFRSSDRVIPAYVLLQMMAPSGRAQLVERATSSAGLNTLSISKISDVQLSVPSLEEQSEVIHRLQEYFAIVDRVEARYSGTKAQVGKLTQSILAKAFRGELVPTEAELAEAEGREFESAEQLLERIREQRVAEPPSKNNGFPRRKASRTLAART